VSQIRIVWSRDALTSCLWFRNVRAVTRSKWPSYTCTISPDFIFHANISPSAKPPYTEAALNVAALNSSSRCFLSVSSALRSSRGSTSSYSALSSRTPSFKFSPSYTVSLGTRDTSSFVVIFLSTRSHAGFVDLGCNIIFYKKFF
jgi:hypothetical protein